MTAKSKVDITLQANIEVHSKLANAGEYNKSPHFRPENQKKVRKILEELVAEHRNKEPLSALDMGCGTGFIVHLIHDLVDEVHGIDITTDMMKQIDTSLGNIILKESTAEDTGFEDNSFDFVTAYSFLDHLLDYKLAFREAYRVLKPGGVFYSDLNPNRAFSNLMSRIDDQNHADLPSLISREIDVMLHNGEYYEKNFGIDKEALENAEPEKTDMRGFDTLEVKQVALEAGFSEVKVEADWFLGQGHILNSDSELSIPQIDAYLRMVLPASDCFFKYLRFVFIK